MKHLLFQIYFWVQKFPNLSITTKKKEKIIVNSGYPRLKPRFKKKRKQHVNNKRVEPKFFNKPADRPCVHYPRLSHPLRLHRNFGTGSHLRPAGISSPYFSRPQRAELLVCHRPSSFRRRMDTPRLIAAAFYRRHGDASLRLSTLSRGKFKSLHTPDSLSPDLREFEAFFSGFELK